MESYRKPGSCLLYALTATASSLSKLCTEGTQRRCIKFSMQSNVAKAKLTFTVYPVPGVDKRVLCTWTEERLQEDG